MSEFSPLVIKDLANLFIGDIVYYQGKSIMLPYHTGSSIEDLYHLMDTEVYHPTINISRWKIMLKLMEKLDKIEQLPRLIDYLFSSQNFAEDAQNCSSLIEFHQKVDNTIQQAIQCINSKILISGKEVWFDGSHIHIRPISEDPVIIPIKNVPKIDRDYVKALPIRIKDNLDNGNYDSVVSQCRTLIEEVCIFIITENNGTPSTSGKWTKLVSDCKKALGMDIDYKNTDSRINDMLNGLEKIVSSICLLRNVGSDAHGVGDSRINITEREAVLVTNCTQAYCEYLLSIHNSHIARNHKD